jgi:hypothetical protein
MKCSEIHIYSLIQIPCISDWCKIDTVVYGIYWLLRFIRDSITISLRLYLNVIIVDQDRAPFFKQSRTAPLALGRLFSEPSTAPISIRPHRSVSNSFMSEYRPVDIDLSWCVVYLSIITPVKRCGEHFSLSRYR